MVRKVVTAVMVIAAGMIATLLPARFWHTINARGIPTFPVMSPLITLCGAITLGVPLFLQHLLASAYDAQRVAALLASRLPRRPDEETIVAGAAVRYDLPES